MINDQLAGRVLTGSLGCWTVGAVWVAGGSAGRAVGAGRGCQAFTALGVDWYLMDASLQNRHYHITY